MSQFPCLAFPVSLFLPGGDVYPSLHEDFLVFLEAEVIPDTKKHQNSRAPTLEELVAALESFDNIGQGGVGVSDKFVDSWDIGFGQQNSEPEGSVILSKKSPQDVHFLSYGSLENTVLPVMERISQQCGLHLVLDTYTMRFYFADRNLQASLAAYESNLGRSFNFF